jgi:hypothetical protein
MFGIRLLPWRWLPRVSPPHNAVQRVAAIPRGTAGKAPLIRTTHG